MDIMNEIKIREELAKTVAEEPDNIDKILKLSHNLALSDKNNVRFSVDSSVIERLGRELVARHETAVSELVKNTYDADASLATLDFIDVDYEGGTLVIEDNGSGMTRDQLINGFMRISSSSKIHEPISPLYKRNRAGKKGIGRFSAQRLGSNLTIITHTKESNAALKIVVDWDEYSMDDDIFFISNRIVEIPKEKENGTKLIIDNLREWWSEAMIKRVYRYAIDVIQPFPLSKIKDEKSDEIIDPGFSINCSKDGIEIASQESMFYQHALAEIDGFVDESGDAYWLINKSKVDAITTNPVQLENTDCSFAKLKGIQFKAYYFIHGSDLIPKQVRSYIKEAAKESGGIRLYRNGFRVLPYAEPQDDWLGLDASIRRRTVLPVHGNINFFGFVEIGDSNDEFIELSSREGLLKNDAYFELIDFLYKSLTAAVNRIASARGRKRKSGQKDWESKYSKTPKDALLDTADDLDKIADEIEEESTSDSSQKEEKKEESKDKRDKEKAEEFRKKAQQLRDAVKSIDELNMVRVLAGLGLIIGEFTHEIMNYLGTFDIDTKYILDQLDKVTEEYKRANRLRNTFDSFKVYASYFDETISQNVNQELRPLELRDVIKPFIKTIEPDTKRNNIKMWPEINGYDLFTCKMHTSEWASILFNLYSNSKKAIKRANQKEGEILIRAGKDNNSLFVEFMDNGDGVPLENRDKIFNAFFTTSSPKGHSASSTDELTGTGLGLKIVSDIVESYNGEISIENAPEGFTTNFRISIPKAKPEEIEEYGL
jgi:signal transduction histidine kinase